MPKFWLLLPLAIPFPPSPRLSLGPALLSCCHFYLPQTSHDASYFTFNYFCENSFITFIPAQTQAHAIATNWLCSSTRSMRRAIFHWKLFLKHTNTRTHNVIQDVEQMKRRWKAGGKGGPLSEDIKLNALWPVIGQFGSWKSQVEIQWCH